VSLAVFSPDHLQPAVLALTFAGRVAGQLGAVLVAGLIVTRLRRVGLRR
jgi:hypothetical protein